MKKPKCLGISVRAAGVAALFLTAAGQAAAAGIYGALLPTSRSVQVGATATAFVTVVNTGTETARNCGLALGTSLNASFQYRTTDSATNLPIEPLGTIANIAAGGSQSWVFGITPNAAFPPTEVTLTMDCENTEPAPVYPGVNTLLLSASTTPVPDVMALAATLANDGVTRAPGFAGSAVFAVAMSNVGVSGSLTAVPRLVGNYGGADILICETNTATGACLSWPPTASASFASGANTNRSFGLFLSAHGRATFDPANTRATVSFVDGAGVVRGSTSVAYETQTQMGDNGGSLEFDRTTVQLGTNSAWAPISIEVGLGGQPPAALPNGFGAVEQVRNVTVSDEGRLNAPVEMVLDYDPAALGGADPMVLHYNAGTGQYEPVTMFDLDTANRTVSIDSRVFSPFVTSGAAELINLLVPAYTVPGFDLATDVWNIANFGSYFAPGGNCLGLAAYAVWFADAHSNEALNGKYSSVGGNPTSIAHLAASRAHLAQSQYWAFEQYKSSRSGGDRWLANSIKTNLFVWKKPLVMRFGSPSGGHAGVVYGWDETGFLIYEVNTAPGVARSAKIPYSNGSFGTYGPYNGFGFLAMPSFGRNEDFAALTGQAEGGFTSSANISLTSPLQDAEVNDRKVRVTGALTGDLASGRKVIAYLNGPTRTDFGAVVSFDKEMPVKFGENTLIMLAGDLSNQSMWYQNASTLVRNFKGMLAPATFRSTLTWNQVGDVDLYVTEPGGLTSWYGGKTTSNGMTLDFDNTSGFGPENITLSLGEGDTLLPGNYGVRVHYYRGTGPVSGKVEVLTYEGEPTQKNQVFNWTISANGSSSTQGPGGTGPQWTDIVTVDVVNNQITP